jgi:ABC-type multidrug transport system fused ATPase/permease subunit
MKSGKVEEMGSYEELMSKKGLFYELAAGRK